MLNNLPSETEKVKYLLWELHEATMDAANDPSRDNLRAVDDLMRKVKKNLPAHFHAQYKAMLERNQGRLPADPILPTGDLP